MRRPFTGTYHGVRVRPATIRRPEDVHDPVDFRPGPGKTTAAAAPWADRAVRQHVRCAVQTFDGFSAVGTMLIRRTKRLAVRKRTRTWSVERLKTTLYHRSAGIRYRSEFSTVCRKTKKKKNVFRFHRKFKGWTENNTRKHFWCVCVRVVLLLYRSSPIRTPVWCAFNILSYGLAAKPITQRVMCSGDWVVQCEKLF